MKKVKYIQIIIILATAVISLSACFYGPPAHHHRPAYYYPYGYYYYPSVRIYFHYSTGFFFYLYDGIWIKTRVLPPHIHLSPHYRVHLNIKSDKPYLFHKQHTKQYQPSPAYKPGPKIDSSERKNLKKWYQEQEEYKKNKRFKDDQKRVKQR